MILFPDSEGGTLVDFAFRVCWEQQLQVVGSTQEAWNVFAAEVTSQREHVDDLARLFPLRQAFP